ncbi:MAG: metalloregulator ArsR/SmtB family transcription factor [Chloroflexi bacterium]|nr:metalloregulator ArsR/SmtB family transcription factor [Chloroflexota bacterium]
MADRAFKDEINEQFARVAKALANAHRIEILDLLAQGERSVDDVARETSLSVANASQHLQALREAHLVATRKEGLRVYYRLIDFSVYELLQNIRTVATRQLADVDRIVDTYLTERRLMEPVTLNELLARTREESVVVLDVRAVLEFKQGHIAGARSIPIDELAERLDELPRDQEIVAYCRGEYCVFADEAVELLNAHGYRTRRLQAGYPDWQLANLPTETD